jgi:hypothetical protein
MARTLPRQCRSPPRSVSSTAKTFSANARPRAGFFLFMETDMDWYIPCAYAPEQKRRFHTHARARLRALAADLGFSSSSYDLRSNPAGIAVSGEITLHHERVYVQVSQSAMGADSGILIRTCEGRRDYIGGRNHFASLAMLDDIPALSARVRMVMGETWGRR